MYEYPKTTSSQSRGTETFIERTAPLATVKVKAGNAAASIPVRDGSVHAWHHADAQIAGFIRGVGATFAVRVGWSGAEAVLACINQACEPEQLAYQTESSQYP